MTTHDKAIMGGGCGCGRTRYRVDREPIFVNNCYCALCQQQSGGTSAVYAYFEAEAVTVLKGNLVSYAARTASDLNQVVMQCADCGVTLLRQPHITGRHGISVLVGTLDDPWEVVPDAAIYVSERMPWVTLPEGIPAFDAYYDPDQLLPPERAARLRAVFARHHADQGQEA
ncbi:GFA family protein [Sphingobium nicotianae]|uniref:GFA family protein n=1 Tax=Sphingobium nicotianae TaxID=2782607 RepID=A0A9X1DC71_9SPHN|nr:GFA family protein [Sphingobium nicotianae]MBT2187442.1 GFA family protein [Sphingobium nicotianae]